LLLLVRSWLDADMQVRRNLEPLFLSGDDLISARIKLRILNIAYFTLRGMVCRQAAGYLQNKCSALKLEVCQIEFRLSMLSFGGS
jgi:hypothetical protein